MRHRIRNQAGAGGIGCLLMVALAAAAIHAGLEFGLPTLRHRSFEDRMNETFTYFSRQPEKNIRGRIIQVASEFDIELKPEQVKVQISGDHLTIEVAYDKTVDLKVWQKTLHFTIRRSGPY